MLLRRSSLCVLLLFALIFPLFLRLPARAQAPQPDWSQATNLSHSAAASAPVVVPGPKGRVQVFWWDEYDGIMTAVFDGTKWQVAKPAPIMIPPPPTPTPEPEAPTPRATRAIEFSPIDVMPTIVGDAQGWAHAFWLGAEDRNTKLRPLLHSRLAFGTTAWSWPNRVSDSASVWDLASTPGGALHILYSRPTQTQARPAGLYHQRSSDGGLSWTPPVALTTSLHFRRTSATASFLRIALGSKSNVYATWDDPESGLAMYDRSADGGRTWEAPRLVDSSDLNARRAEIVSSGESEVMLFWESTRSGVPTGVYQQRSADAGATWRGPEQMMKSWATSAQGLDFQAVAEGRTWLIAGGQPGALGLSLWERERASESEMAGWSDVNHIALSAGEAEGQKTIEVDSWRAELRDGVVNLVGQGRDRDIWALRIPADAIKWTSTPAAVWSGSVVAPEPKTDTWSEPVNLSHSGSAAQPILVTGREGTAQVFWWDQFDGLLSSYYDGKAWFAASASPIMISQIVARADNSGTLGELAVHPLGAMPQLVGDQKGLAHAFWLTGGAAKAGEQEASETSASRALMHSALAIGSTTWSEAHTVADSVLAWKAFADPAGRVHLIFVRPTQTSAAPAGYYYTRLAEDGSGWLAPEPLQASIYARLLTPEQVHLAGAADAAGNIYVAWNDPRQGCTFYARSADSGKTWEAPAKVSSPDIALPQLASLDNGLFLALWQANRSTSSAVLYQQRSTDGGRTWDAPERVLEKLTASTQALSLYQDGQGSLLLVAGVGSASLTLAAWSSVVAQSAGISGWSEPQQLQLSIKDPETEKIISLDALGIGVSGERVSVVGRGQDGEIWALQRPSGGLNWFYAPPPPWSEPARVSQGEGYPGLPAMVADREGRAHILWSEAAQENAGGTALYYASWDGTQLGQPTQILSAAEGKVENPSLATTKDRLHAVWSGGENGQIYYSRSFLRDATAAGGWSEPLSIRGPEQAKGVGASPCLVTDLGGNLHLVYAVPLNEGRGIYYLRSDDGGESWSELYTVFEATAAGWPSVESPRLAVDVDGTIYVVWLRAALSGQRAEGVYFAQSRDGGRTWSEPFTVAEGTCTWPQIAIARPGEVHVIWHEMTGNGVWTHRWTIDGGQNWAPAMRLRGYSNMAGRAALAYDLAGQLHLLGITANEAEEPLLRYTTWDAETQRWGEANDARLGYRTNGSPDVVAALLPAQGLLDAVFGHVVIEGESVELKALHFIYRSVTPTAQAVMFQPTPLPTATATPIPTETPKPIPTPTVNPNARNSGTPSVSLGPLSLPLVGLGGIMAASLLIVGTMFLRSVRLKRGGKYYRKRY